MQNEEKANSVFKKKKKKKQNFIDPTEMYMFTAAKRWNY